MAEPYTVKTRGYGLPDYSQPQPLGQVPVGPVYTSTDTAELAARLGSPVTFDRRGNVIWFDDFENGINMWLFVGCTLRWVSSTTRSKGFCMAVDATGIDHSYHFQHYLRYPTLSRLGVEISETMPGGSSHIDIRLYLNNGTADLVAAAQYNHATHEMSIATSYHGFPVAELVYEPIGPPLFYPWVAFETIKLVANFDTGYYERLIVNANEYDISSHLLATHAFITTPYLATIIGGINNTVGTSTVYIDDVIITQQEPANPVE